MGREQNLFSGHVKSGVIKFSAMMGTVSALSIMASLGAHAQDADEGGADAANQEPREQIFVTANRREESALDVPISIDVLGTAELRARDIRGYEDLALAVSGLVSTGDGGGAFPRSLYLRGVSNFSGPTPSVGLYLDEAPISVRADRQANIRIYDIERVEVLKGPQGTLYGQGSMGGTIRFIAKKPDTNDFGFFGEAGVSFTDGGGANQKVTGVVNVPLVQDTLALRVAGEVEHNSGWINRPSADLEDLNSATSWDMRISGLWRPSENFSLLLTANIHRNDIDAPNNIGDADKVYTPAFGLALSPRADDDSEIFNATANYEFAGLDLLSSTTYLETSKFLNFRSQRAGVGAALSPIFGIAAVDRTNDAESFSQEVRLSNAPSADRFHWHVGGFYRDYSFRGASENFVGLDGGALPGSRFSDNEELSESWAVFGNASFELTERLELGAGVRYFEDQAGLINHITGTEQETTFDDVSTRVFLKYAFTDDAQVYASVAKGFRSGRFNSNVVLPAVEPEIVWTYELGFKGALAQGRFVVDAAVFFNDISDYQVTGFDPNVGASLTGNAGDGETIGFEISFDWQVTDNFSLSATGAYYDSELTKLGVTRTAINVGDKLDFVSEYNFTFAGQYDFVLLEREASALLTYSQQGPSVMRASRTFPVAESDTVNMLNFNLDVAVNDHLNVSVFASNLLNVYDIQSPNFTQPFQATFTKPRTVGARATTEF